MGEEIEEEVVEEDPRDQEALRFESYEEDEKEKEAKGRIEAMSVEDEEERQELEERRQTPPDIDIPYSPSLASHVDDPEEELEPRQDAQVKVHRMALPLPSKSADDRLRGVSDIT